MAIVTPSLTYWPNPSIGRPLFNGTVYVGEPDLDPTILVNQKQITLRLEDGSTVAVGQPLTLSSGGVLEYNGSYAVITVDGEYSVAAYAQNGTLAFYIPNNEGLFDASDITYNSTTVGEYLDAIMCTSYVDIRSKLTSGQLIAGYYASLTSSASESGIGVVVEATGTEYTDNGADVITESGGTTSASERVWLRVKEENGRVNVKHLGIDSAGVDDVSAIVNPLITLGYSVFFPAGVYRWTSNMSALADGQEVVGESRNAVIFNVESTTGSGFITSAQYCRVNNIAFRYPNQDTTITTGTPTVYPPTIYGSGYFCEFSVLDMGNCYQAFQIGGTTEGSASKVGMFDIIGAPIRTGLSLERVLDVPRISDIHWNYNYLGNFQGDTTYTYSTYLKNWIHENADAFQFGRCDFGAPFRLFAFGYYRGIYLKSTRFTGSAESMKFTDCEIDITQRPIHADDWTNRVDFIGGKFVGNKDDATLTSTEVGKILVDDVGSTSATAFFSNVKINDFKGDAVQAGANVEFSECSINGFGVDNTSGRNAIQMVANNRALKFSGGFVDASSGTGTRCFYDGGNQACRLYLSGGSELSGATLESWRWSGTDSRDYVDNSTQITGGGAQARTSVSFIQNIPKVIFGISMPTSGTWNRGDTVENTEPTVTGSASSQYIVRGWTRITTGSGNVLNTDWVEVRTLTGT